MTSASFSDQSSCSLSSTSSARLMLIKVDKIELESPKRRCISRVVSGLFIGSIVSEDNNDALGDSLASLSICARSSAVTGSSRLVRWFGCVKA